MFVTYNMHLGLCFKLIPLVSTGQEGQLVRHQTFITQLLNNSSLRGHLRGKHCVIQLTSQTIFVMHIFKDDIKQWSFGRSFWGATLWYGNTIRVLYGYWKKQKFKYLVFLTFCLCQTQIHPPVFSDPPSTVRSLHYLPLLPAMGFRAFCCWLNASF